MKTLRRHWITITGTIGTGLLILATAIAALSQTAPVLDIVSLGTNGFSITVTNGSPTSTYTLLQTHVLGDLTAHPWKFVASGLTGQTNFTVPVPGPIATEFYQVVATNFTIGSFGMFIDSPVNGANLTQ